MFQILVVLFSLFSALSMAMDVEHPAYVRDKRFHLKKELVDLPGMQSSTHFIGESFIILDGKTDEPVEMNGSEKSARAATVYLALNKTRDFFVQSLNSEYVKNLKQIKVRLDISNDYSDVAHFAHDDFNPKFNNALTITPSKAQNLIEGIDSWDYEIWFRPVKEKKRRNDLNSAISQFDGSSIQSNMVSNLIQSDITSTLQQAMYNQSFSDFNGEFHLETMAVSLGMIYIFPKTIKLFTKNLKSKYYLDTASIPEVSMHEFSHVALSDFLTPKRKSPVIEGMANYFTGKILNRAKWGDHAKHHAKNMAGKNANSIVWYETKLELESLSTSDFVYKLLWKVDLALGEKGMTVIYQSRKYVNSASNIKKDLASALMRSIDELYPSQKNILKLKLQEVLQIVGL